MSSTTPHFATTTVAVEGMTCGACTAAIEGGFKDVEGVGSISVSLLAERAVVMHDPALLSAEKIAELIEDRGFGAAILSTDMPRASRRPAETKPKQATTTVKVEGMTCGACTAAIEGGFKDVLGVLSFTVSLMTERAVVVHDPDVISKEKVAEIIEDRGFGAEVLSSEVTGRPKKSKGPARATTTVAVDGMTCGACTAAIEGGFKDVEGVISFTVSLITERAVAVHDPEIISAEKIAEIIEDRGFDASIISTELDSDDSNDSDLPITNVTFKIFGLTDDDSALHLEETLRTAPGVQDVIVSLSSARATVYYFPDLTGLRNIVEIVESIGMNALLSEAEENNAQLESLSKTKEINEWRNAFQFSLAFALPVFLISMIIPMVFMRWDKMHFGGRNILIPGLYLGDLICLVLTIPVQFGIGKRFYKSAYKSLKHGSATMDVLVVLGTSAAFFFSIGSMLTSIMCHPHSRPNTVFDTSTMLITFISLGRYLENKAKGQTSKALSRLMSLAPSMATIYADPEKAALMEGTDDQSHGNERVIPTELIQVGDIVILRPGDKVPADGTVTAGESYVDESMVTGEAMPVLKRKRDNLIGGTVNGAGRLDFRVTRAGRDTQLSQIVKLVQEAQTSRAPIQRMADIVAGYFVPGVITLGAITFVGWMILSHVLTNPPAIFKSEASGGTFMVCLKLCISVIVFACPCALGLSTPTAVMVGTGVGAEHGILVKGGAALETATKVTHVVMDKTGTLTMGKMSVALAELAQMWGASEWRTKMWWTLVGVAEQGSEHPVGKAIVNGARERLGLQQNMTIDGTVSEFKAVVGRGVQAKVEVTSAAAPGGAMKFRILIGNVTYLAENGVKVPEDAVRQVRGEYSKPGEGKMSAEQEEEIARMRGRTYVFVAIDGEYAGMIGLSDEVKPDAKYAVRALQKLGIKVAMVTGDQEATALQIAKEVGIPAHLVWAGVSPDDKQRIVREMKESNSSSTLLKGAKRAENQKVTIAMVGDGINDSPALATADVGIAMASGTDVAMEAADIVLMRPNCLLDIPAALHLSKCIFKRIKMNLLWACLYNIIGLPFAMGFFLPFGFHLHPMAAAAAMAASSVSVVCSSLLLKFWKRPTWMTPEGMEAEMKGRRSRVKMMDGAESWWRGLLWWRQRKTHEEAGYIPVAGDEAV
ncbi:putative copper-transporting ATPase [Kalaharituber pfeilii]|nr:putative copper-transporting ATPase [Kalaharituber pfeilii]